MGGASASYRTPELQDGVTFDEVTREQLSSGARYRLAGGRAANGPQQLQLTTSTHPCVDSMSGDWFPWSARLVTGDGTYPGCARPGRAAVARAGG